MHFTLGTDCTESKNASVRNIDQRKHAVFTSDEVSAICHHSCRSCFRKKLSPCPIRQFNIRIKFRQNFCVKIDFFSSFSIFAIFKLKCFVPDFGINNITDKFDVLNCMVRITFKFLPNLECLTLCKLYSTLCICTTPSRIFNHIFSERKILFSRFIIIAQWIIIFAVNK